MAKIELRGKSLGVFALVDDADLEKASQYKWYLSTTGKGKRSQGYAVTVHHIKGKSRTDRDRSRNFSLHRFLLGFPDGVVDHINGDTLDNRRENLRVVNHQINNRNALRRQPRAETLPINVQRGNGCSTYSVNIAGVYYGAYSTPELAGRVADVVRRKLGFTMLNYPDDPLPDNYHIVNWNCEARAAEHRSDEVGVSWFKPKAQWRFIWKKKTLGYFRTEQAAIDFKLQYLSGVQHESSSGSQSDVAATSTRIRRFRTRP